MADFGEIINKFLAILASIFQALGPDNATGNIGMIDKSFDSFGDFSSIISTTPALLDRSRFPIQTNRKVCRSTICQDYASFTLSSLQRDLDPCDDFYLFACGGFLSNGSLPNVREIIDKQTQLRIQEVLESNDPSPSQSIIVARQIYSTCLNKDAIEQGGSAALRALLDQLIGGWPLITPNWNASAFSLYESLRRLKTSGYDSIFRWNITRNPNDNLKRIINLGQAVLGLKSPDFYTQDSIRQAYKTLIGRVTDLMVETNVTNDNTLDIRDLLEFESNLANNLSPPSETNSSQNLMTFNNFVHTYLLTSTLGQEILPLFQDIFSQVQLQGLVNSSTVINVENPDFFQRLGIQLQTLNRLGDDGNKILANYLGWNVVLSQLPLLPSDFRSVLEEFAEATGNPINASKSEIGNSHRQQCVDLVVSGMPLAVESTYVSKFVSNQSIPKIMEIVGGIRTAARIYINNSSWLDAIAKMVTLQMVGDLIDLIGYPDFIINNITRLDTIYKEVSATNVHFNNVQSLLRLTALQSLQKLAESNSRDIEEDVDPNDTIVQYYFDQNVIVIPAALMQFPLFDPGVPDYLNYAGIGYQYAVQLASALAKTEYNSTVELINITTALQHQYSTFRQSKNFSALPEELFANNLALLLVANAYDNRSVNGDTLLMGLDQFSKEMELILAFSQNFCQNVNSLTVDFQTIEQQESRAMVDLPLINLGRFNIIYNCSMEKKMNSVSKVIL